LRNGKTGTRLPACYRVLTRRGIRKDCHGLVGVKKAVNPLKFRKKERARFPKVESNSNRNTAAVEELVYPFER
jgi:hypothetical protein